MMKTMDQFLSGFWNDESGISSVEYALLLAFVSAAIVAGATTLSGAVQTELNQAATCISTGTCS